MRTATLTNVVKLLAHGHEPLVQLVRQDHECWAKTEAKTFVFPTESPQKFVIYFVAKY
jgi:hypothetical protein